jgi:hypothetical protein
MDYSAMPLQRLRLLDKARDATLAFILKQIDKAEEDAKCKEQNQNTMTSHETPSDNPKDNVTDSGRKADAENAELETRDACRSGAYG